MLAIFRDLRIAARAHWIAYAGLLVVAYVAVDMIYRGVVEVAAAV